MIEEMAEKLFAQHCTRAAQDAAERGAFPQALWDAIEAAGLPMMMCAEQHGGAGASIEDVAAVLQCAGRHAAPIPLAEAVLSRWLCSQAGIQLNGPCALSIGPKVSWVLRRRGQDVLVGGLDDNAAWVPTLPLVVGIANGNVFVVRTEALQVGRRPNISSEPLASIMAEDAVLVATAPMPNGVDAAHVLRLASLSRAILCVGALQQVLDLSLAYVQMRTQFGRPLAKFQAVQQQLAQLGGAVAAAQAITEAAVRAMRTGSGPLLAAAARVRVADAIDTAAGVAHQVHGAMGFSHEYALHLSTRRLWAWRDQYGSAMHWQRELGRAFVGTQADALWAMISDLDAELTPAAS